LSYSRFFEKKGEYFTGKSKKANNIWGMSSKNGLEIIQKVLKKCRKYEQKIKMSMDCPENFEKLLNGVICAEENGMNIDYDSNFPI
jgi:hypothetical protein